MRKSCRIVATILLIGVILGINACTNDARQDVERTTLSKSQRDSTLAETGLRGASTVGKALDIADSAAARAARANEAY